MKKLVVSALVLAIGAGAAFAQSAAIGERQALFKEMGKATGGAVGMLKGEAPFNLDTVKAALALYADHSDKLKALFPDDSKEGAKTAALPAIWEKKDEFNGIFDKLKADATAANAAIMDASSFKAEFGKVLGNCKACHDNFKKPD
jgi:cytochrome c556